ncbi:MAG TPA: hypothetical protein VJX92_20090 [Methylomirabilota bacterium]|nr:hypothetical protein [Methylomirabilota bacterium]
MNQPRQNDPNVKEMIYRVAPTTLHATVFSGSLTFDTFWYCLPDTVDPRGPKGK